MNLELPFMDLFFCILPSPNNKTTNFFISFKGLSIIKFDLSSLLNLLFGCVKELSVLTKLIEVIRSDFIYFLF